MTGNATSPTQSSEIRIEVFSTCPQSKDFDRSGYLQQIINVARWSEEAGCTGILVYTDNGIVDPWLCSQVILENTDRLCPLVAIQPIYMHPYTVAKMTTTYGYLYNRRIYFNMLAGGFKNDLIALNDNTPHDKRYDRTVEYTQIIKRLLENPGAMSHSGEFYTVENLKLTPPLPQELFPGIFISGSSEAGLNAARAIQAVAVQYPQPPEEYEKNPIPADLTCGIRIGIIARDQDDEAWRVALERFPEDRKGQLTHQLAMKVSDSHWHKQLSELGQHSEDQSAPSTYWLGPFQNYKTNCPYLVGNYSRVAEEVARYILIGYQTFILDIPPSQEELQHINLVFKQAESIARGRQAAPQAAN
jgi:alkanesulfonate monooxygenase